MLISKAYAKINKLTCLPIIILISLMDYNLDAEQAGERTFIKAHFEILF
jgi:hypothetical protein